MMMRSLRIRRLLLVLGMIVSIGMDTATAGEKGAIFTPEQIARDLIGQSVGFIGMPKVTLKSGRTATSDTDSTTTKQSMELSSDTLGYTFTEDDLRTVQIVEKKIQGPKASIVVSVDTVSSFAGRLRLYYELIAGEWYLKQIENLSFKPY